ncbi:MAG: S-layer homology domain-containing protein [Ruminococcaceae bacterium]|nr:S-layer homology domain-containing protein [Oscillospiraceae bacterium]
MKRLACLILTLALLLSCVAFSVSAADRNVLPFTDADQINHYADCAILYDLGVISGNPDGTFNPGRNVTRAEAAVMACRLLDITVYGGVCKAADIYKGHWAESYIAYVVDMGMMTLSPDGRFQPNLAVTVRDFCRTMLRLLGYENVTDSRIESLIEQTNLLSGFEKGLDQFITRDDCCLLLYNAASCYQIERWVDGKPIYYTDALLNPTSLFEHRFGLIRYTELLTANEYADLNLHDGHLEKGYTKIAEHRAFNVSTGLEYVGRRVDIFVKDDEVVGLPHVHTDETCLSFKDYLTYEAFMFNNGFSVGAETQYYFNYQLSDRYCLIGEYDRSEIICVDSNNDRVFDLVLVVACEEAKFTSAVPVRIEFPDGTKELIPGEHVIYGEVKEGDTVYVVCVSGIWHIFSENE